MVLRRSKEKMFSSTIASVIMAGIGAILAAGGIYAFAYGFSRVEYIMQAFPQTTGTWSQNTIAGWGAEMMLGGILAATGTFFIIYAIHSLLIVSPPGSSVALKKSVENEEE